MKEAKKATIDGKTYAVVGVTVSGSRGREYQLSSRKRDDGSWIIERVCHAPERKVHSATASGKTTIYHWEGSDSEEN